MFVVRLDDLWVDVNKQHQVWELNAYLSNLPL